MNESDLLNGNVYESPNGYHRRVLLYLGDNLWCRAGFDGVPLICTSDGGELFLTSNEAVELLGSWKLIGRAEFELKPIETDSQ